MKFTIRTHNPWLLFLAFSFAMLISIIITKDRFSHVIQICICLGFVAFIMSFVYFLNGKITEFDICSESISGVWMHAPFFKRKNQTLLFSEIKTWKFTKSRLVDSVSIKTNSGKTFYIKCLDLIGKQKSLEEMLKTFQANIEIYNAHCTDSQKIKAPPSFYESLIAKVFAALLIPFLIFFSYKIYNHPAKDLGIVRVILVYFFSSLYIILVLISYFKNRRSE